MIDEHEVKEYPLEKELKMIDDDPYSFKYIDNPSEEVCEYALKKDGWLLVFIEKQTPHLVSIAMQQTPHVIKIIDKKLLNAVFVCEDGTIIDISDDVDRYRQSFIDGEGGDPFLY